jgi:hypothetical protein
VSRIEDLYANKADLKKLLGIDERQTLKYQLQRLLEAPTAPKPADDAVSPQPPAIALNDNDALSAIALGEPPRSENNS